MTSDKQPITIKKYANRRLYNTGTSSYVTLEDLADMVKKADDFVVYDAKSGEDITRSVLTQIIFEQEGKGGQQGLMPIAFLRQLIRFYGDSMQMLVPSYLEFTIDKLTSEQQKFRDQVANSLGTSPLTAPTRQMFGSLEEQTRKNMAMFSQALGMFRPFSSATAHADDKPAEPSEASQQSDIDDMRRQLDELQKRIDSLKPRD
jgi:polyhydroxyalkanoate synthesis repressor PhaR